MRKGITGTVKPSRATYEILEEMVRLKVQEYIQDILEEEVEAFLGRKKSKRITMIDGTPGYWNGHGKPKKFSVMNGTITVRRPRVRETEERFESKIIPFFKRRSKKVGQLLPELYLHGLAKGDFELALRGLLGEGAPLSASSIDRLKAKWQMEYEEWKQLDMSKLEIVYQWADGIYVKAGLEKDKAALLVIIGIITFFGVCFGVWKGLIYFSSLSSVPDEFESIPSSVQKSHLVSLSYSGYSVPDTSGM